MVTDKMVSNVKKKGLKQWRTHKGVAAGLQLSKPSKTEI
jgi:hypothetical protein